MEAAPNDLWHGQATALDEWHAKRERQDVLLSLNTGSGKTIIGLLMAQSLVNEGVSKVIYCCPTIDLVRQTSREATRIGIKHTTRVEREFNNDLFESGNAFCVTTYQALLNGHSNLRRRHFPGAVLFDDAHVAEGMIRDAVTLRIDGSTRRELFNEVAGLFEPSFEDVGKRSRFRNTVEARGTAPPILLTPPTAVQGNATQLSAILDRHGIQDDKSLTYPYEYLRDRLAQMAVVFGPNICEITPPFLPTQALDVFERPIRRIYLSATLRSKTEFIRAFGRRPDVVIEPDADAGNGERLVLFSRGLVTDSISPDLVNRLAENHKVLIAVPNYRTSEQWAPCATPPESSQFSEALDAFRASTHGVFLLVQRTDGIDLPHNACRLMVIDRMPVGAALLERFQFDELRMATNYASRIANRIVQLFGRINRGRNDYGVFLINGRELNAWLHNHRNISLLPPLLQKQILLGRQVQEGMEITNDRAVVEIIDQVLGRNQSWLDYYGSNLDGGTLDGTEVARATEAEKGMERAAEAEARFAAALWNGDHDGARLALEPVVDQTSSVDALSAGWQLVWLGACYEALGDGDAARAAFRDARTRLGDGIALPLRAPRTEVTAADTLLVPLTRSMLHTVADASDRAVERRIGQMRARMRDLDGATPNQMEEAVRVLGEFLGFKSTRPDNDEGTGPDVLWCEDESSLCVGFELKTDKQAPGKYSKKEIGQGHDHLSYIHDRLPDYRCLGLIYVGPQGECLPEANPSDEMWLTDVRSLVDVRDQTLAIASDCKQALPIERHSRVVALCERPEWKLDALAVRLRGAPLLR